MLNNQAYHFFLEKIPTFAKGIMLFSGLFCLAHTSNAEPIKELINKSLSSHPLIMSAQSGVNSAQADVESAKWQYYPTPSVQVTTADISSEDTVNTDPLTTFSLEQPLWTGGRLTGGSNRASANLTDSEENLKQIKRNLALRVIEAYGNWYGSSLRIQAWEESLAVHFRLKGTVIRRFEEGVAANSDKMLAESRLESVIADLASARAEEYVALSELSQLTGGSIAKEDLLSSPGNLPPIDNDLGILTQRAIALSPSVKQALAQAEQVKADITIQKSEYWPDVFLRLDHQFGNDDAITSASDSQVSFGLRSSFGAGLSTLSTTRSIQERYQASLSQVDAERRNVNEQVQSDYYLSESFKARLSALKSATTRTEEVFSSFNRQYLAGRKTWFDLLNSARDLVQTKIQLADAESAHLVVIWRLAVLTQELDGLVRYVQSENNE